jgi:hypothetical protein
MYFSKFFIESLFNKVLKKSKNIDPEDTEELDECSSCEERARRLYKEMFEDNN